MPLFLAQNKCFDTVISWWNNCKCNLDLVSCKKSGRDYVNLQVFLDTGIEIWSTVGLFVSCEALKSLIWPVKIHFLCVSIFKHTRPPSPINLRYYSHMASLGRRVFRNTGLSTPGDPDTGFRGLASDYPQGHLLTLSASAAVPISLES